MTEAFLTIGFFAVPVLAGAIVEQRKAEKERMVQEIDCILEQEKQKKFRWGMAYEKNVSNNVCLIQSVSRWLRRLHGMQKWLDKFFKQEEPTIPRPLYSLEQENQILHDMVREIAEQRNEYRIENQRLRDEIAWLKQKLESRYE
ncbi:TPA: hypothetical protein ACGOV5_002246 [Streptococcus suis]